MAQPSPKLTGQEVGRLVLQDLAAIHINVRRARKGDEPLKIMTPAEKADLVNSLTEPAEVAAYNDFRYFHEFLARANLYFNVHQQNADSRFWQIRSNLEILRLAEAENRNMLLEMPQITTRADFDRGRSLFHPAGERAFGRGVAILEIEGFPEGTYPLTRDGRYQYPIPAHRCGSLAENFVEHGPSFISLLASYRAALKEALVIKAALEVFGKFLKVSELGDMVKEVDLRPAEELNELMAEIPPLVVRRGLTACERPEAEVRAHLTSFLIPVEIKGLRPTAKLKIKAGRAMDFSVAQGNSEKIYEILRREAKS